MYCQFVEYIAFKVVERKFRKKQYEKSENVVGKIAKTNVYDVWLSHIMYVVELTSHCVPTR